MDSESAVHTSGETLANLQRLLIDWGALEEKHLGAAALESARDALHDRAAYGSVISLVRNARRTAASMRERLSADFWSLLGNLERDLAERAQTPLSEAEALQQAESALQILAALAGLVQENMNRAAGWRFLDMGRRIERGINTCRIARTFAHDAATPDDLDLLLDLADSQITYRARYLVGLALTPVRDMIMLDPFNTRALAFQVQALKTHLASLPSLLEDGMLEAPSRLLLPLATEVETADAQHLTPATMQAFEKPAAAFRRDRRPVLPAGRPRGADREARRAGVIYALRHRTTYRYEDAVGFARCVLRLTPRTSATQTVLAHALRVTPRPSDIRSATGPFGEGRLHRGHRHPAHHPGDRGDLAGRRHAPRPPDPTRGPAWKRCAPKASPAASWGHRGRRRSCTRPAARRPRRRSPTTPGGASRRGGRSWRRPPT